MSNLKHGMTRTKIYGIWMAMVSRCINPNNKSYKNYGARGISVCAEWKNFINFYNDMGKRPEGLTLDRRDNNKGYSKENCRWADRKTQSRNKRGLRMITAFGRTMSMGEWSEEINISVSTIWARINKGWSAEDAVSIGILKQVEGIPRKGKLRDYRDKSETSIKK